MAGIHVEEEAEEQEVDNSLRGRLLSLVEKINSLRKKKEEEPTEVEEEPKPSKISSHSFINVFVDFVSCRCLKQAGKNCCQNSADYSLCSVIH